MARRLHWVLLSFLALALFAGCGGGGGGSSVQGPGQAVDPYRIPDALKNISGTVPLTHSPLNLNDITYIIPLGNLNPPGHTTPTNHQYFVFSGGVDLRPVYAPANGYIIKIKAEKQANSPTPNDFQVHIAYTSTFFSYFGHVLELDQAVIDALGGQITQSGEYDVAIPVMAGQIIGRSEPGTITMALDFGLINREYTVTGLVHPEKYPPDTSHKDSPLKYFIDPLRTQLRAKVHRAAEDKDGKFDYDIPGRLSGNWFGPNYVSGNLAISWANQLAFVGDMYDHSRMLVSMGGELGATGTFAINPNDPLPQNVSVSTGKVAYRLYSTSQGGIANFTHQDSLLIVQLIDDNRIRVECFPGSSASDAQFTKYARVYSR